jgi:hypothetical protein
MNRRVWLGSLLLSIGGLACYRYQPTTLDAVPQGAKVRAVLSATASEQLRTRHGVNSVRHLDATVLENHQAAVSLWVASGPVTPEFGGGALFQQVDVLKSDIVRVDLRELDRGKTTFVAFGGAAVIAAVARAAIVGGSGESNGGNGGVPPESRRTRLPILTIQF